MRKVRVEQWNRKKQIELVAILVTLVFVLGLGVFLSWHQTRHAGGAEAALGKASHFLTPQWETDDW